ncbi:MAG: hypothetical protein QXD03_05825 [Candidatus Anstonellales archaeon]
MDYKKLEEYFEKYIINYHPYSDYDTYRSIFEYIRDYYLNDSYCKIPILSKMLVENSILSYHIYDSYLESFGFPKDIIQSLTPSEKEILILSATDYLKYKSTIYMVKDIASRLSNELSVYELYIVMKNNNFYFTPVPIYLSESVRRNPLSILTGKLYKYIDIYLKADYYYVGENEILNLYKNNMIFFPLKSNLILLDFFLSYDDTSLFKRLLESIVINTFRDVLIDIKISLPYYVDYEYVCSKNVIENQSRNLIFESSYNSVKVTIYESIVLYYYLYLSYYNAIFPVLPLVDVPVITSDLSSVRYTISDLDYLISKYNEIENRDDAVEYYYVFIKDVFSIFISNHEEITVNDLKERIYENMPNLSQIIDGIEKYVNDYILVNKAMIYSTVLGNISNSIKAFAYSISETKIKNILIGFADSLPRINPNDKKTSSIHKILMELKPYHTQILSKYRLVEISNDNFNVIRPDDRSVYEIKIESDSVRQISDDHISNVLYNNYNESYPIITGGDISISIIKDDEIGKTHDIFSMIKSEHVTKEIISDYFVIRDF